MPRPKLNKGTASYANYFAPESIDRTRPIGLQVYELVRLNIILEHLKPGAQLNEHDLGKWLGVSRTPIREAYQKLALDSLIVSVPQVGTIVAQIDPDRVEEGIIIRRALEREVVKLLCTKDVDLGTLAQCLVLQSTAVSKNDHIEFFQEDEKFHEELAVLAGIPSAWRLAHSVKAHVDRARISLTANLPLRINRAFNEHQKILDALQSRDVEMSLALISHHINSAFERVDVANAG